MAVTNKASKNMIMGIIDVSKDVKFTKQSTLKIPDVSSRSTNTGLVTSKRVESVRVVKQYKGRNKLS